MKKIIIFMLGITLACSLQSCKDEAEDNSEWRDANEAAFNSISKNSDYKPATTPEGPGTVYYKVIQSGAGKEHPLYTSKVKIHYYGTYYNGEYFTTGTGPDLKPDDPKTTFSPSEVVSGFGIALQNMVVGDKWEVWVPWSLGYGSGGRKDQNTGKQTILGYSTLVFYIELLEINQYPPAE